MKEKMILSIAVILIISITAMTIEASNILSNIESKENNETIRSLLDDEQETSPHEDSSDDINNNPFLRDDISEI